MIGIELVAPTKLPSATGNRDRAAGVILENDRVRVTRFSLGPGGKSEIHSDGMYVLVSVGRGRLTNVRGKAEQQVVETAGFLCVGVDRQPVIFARADARMTNLAPPQGPGLSTSSQSRRDLQATQPAQLL